MKYKLVAIDLDGTAVNKDGLIIPSAREAIARAMAKGMMVTLATGRMYRPSNRFAQELGLSAPLICYQGALIREPHEKKILWHKPLPLTLAKEVVEQVRKIGVHKYVFINDEMYVEEIHEKDEWYASRNFVKLNLVKDLFQVLRYQPTEIAARGTAEEIDRVAAHLKSYFGDRLTVTEVHSMFCEIGSPESGKGNALKYLAGVLGIAQEETVAIGDGPNDVSMFKWAGLAIALGDAPEEVKAAADWVIDDGSDDNCAKAIDRLLSL